MVATLSSPENKVVWSGYRLRRLRGFGAFGRVYEAQAPNGSLVALKLIPIKSSAAVPEIRNVRLVSQLSHPNVVRVEKVWCERERLLIVMELGDGSLQDLAEISQIEFGASLSAKVLTDYFCQAAAGIDFLNSRKHSNGDQLVGIQHRDIKPSNLMLFGDQVKLCDFGLATTITAPFVGKGCAGTAAYAGPEVFRDELSNWTDQFALAVSYCQLRGGRMPFRDTPKDFCRDYKRSEPDLSMLDDGERPIIARALSTVPQNRWPSCAEMTRRLAALAPSQSEPDRSERRLEGRRLCPHRPKIDITIPGDRARRQAAIVNISSCGMGLVLDGALSTGMSFLFSLTTCPKKEARLLSARVVRGNPQPDGQWFVGCRLRAAFSAGELAALSGVAS